MAQTVSVRSIVIALALTALSMLGIVVLLSTLGPDWSAYSPASCTATHCFCEMPRIGALVLQPADSWSSYGYAFAGFLMIVLAGRRDWTSAMPPLAARTFGLTAIVVGLGSVLMHATLTLWGQFFDVLGMYLVASFLLVRAVARWRDIPDRPAILIYLLGCAALVAVLIVMPEVRRWLFAVELVLAIAVELIFARPLRPGVRVGFYLGGILAKAIAFAIWILDQRGVVCAPHSLWQGHAVWHLLGATSLWLSFCYYRSERPAGSVG